jgi:hypothetical protein
LLSTPNYSVHLNSEFINHLQNCLDKIRLSQNTFVVLLGDFNAHFDEGSASTSSDFGAYLYRYKQAVPTFAYAMATIKKQGDGTAVRDLGPVLRSFHHLCPLPMSFCVRISVVTVVASDLPRSRSFDLYTRCCQPNVALLHASHVVVM